jgi:MYXO-CTERM domain-containing protein
MQTSRPIDRQPALLELRHVLVCAIALWALPDLVLAAPTRAPYLQSPTPFSITIMWQTDLNARGASLVHYGTSPTVRAELAIGTAAVSASAPGLLNHTVSISGLQPATKYYYDVGTPDELTAGGTAEHYFVTAPAIGAIRPFSFWVAGDSGTDGANQHAVRDAMLAFSAAAPPDLFLQVGDMAYDAGSDADFTRELFGVYADTLRHTPFWPVLGNHEASEGDSDSATQSGPYYEAFNLPSAGEAGGRASGSEAYYAFDYANAHFIALDTDDSSLLAGSPQLSWLEADLASVAATQQWLIVWFHHPPYSNSNHDSDDATDSDGRMVRVRENVVPILEAGGVDLVLAGHSHAYERSYLIQGVYHLGVSPNFATPAFASLQSAGRIVGSDDHNYVKQAGVRPFGGTVYVVAGHGGNELGGRVGHPVMRYEELRYGSCLVNVDGTTLRLRNVRADGVVSDEFVLSKPVLPCTAAVQCDDGERCTIDACTAGGCTNTAISCPAGQACSPISGECVCTEDACNDGNVCTIDKCESATACVHSALDCDDENACTIDACEAVTGCAHATLNCDDGDACTIDGCKSATGCAHAALPCDDGDACTIDSCESATGCAHAALNCDDGDACTTDKCESATGCAHAALACDDGDACTTDKCESATGCAHAALACGDSDACTTDSCDPAHGCFASFNAEPCDDFQPCTIDDRCRSGNCSGTPRDCSDATDACNAGLCDPQSGACTTRPHADGTRCPEGRCLGGTCVAQPAAKSGSAVLAARSGIRQRSNAIGSTASGLDAAAPDATASPADANADARVDPKHAPPSCSVTNATSDTPWLLVLVAAAALFTRKRRSPRMSS